MADPSAPDAAKADRAARLAAELRENLKRRKAQARSRRAGAEDPRAGLDAASAGRVEKAPESEDDVSSS